MRRRSPARERFLFPKEPALSLAALLGRPMFGGPKLGEGWGVTYGHSARYALHRLLVSMPRTLRDEVLVPAYACIALVEPILAAGYKVRFFDNPSITGTDLGLVGSLMTERTLALVAIHYFGYRQDTTELATLCRDRGVLLLENFTHSLPVRDFIEHADELRHCDIALFSLKKMLPVPDGGFAVHRSSLRIAAEVAEPPPRLEIARELYRAAERSLGSRRWRPSGGAGDAPPNPRLMPQPADLVAEIAASMHSLDRARVDWGVSTTSRRMWASVDLDAVVGLRRRNFALIRKALAGMPGVEFPFRDAPEEACLWGVPFLTPGVRDVDYRLRSLGIPVFTFARALHPLLGPTGFGQARSWAEELKLLPVHQDITPEDIGHIRPAFEAALRPSP